MEEMTCPKCGKALPTDAPRGICPACLIQAGLASPSITAVTNTLGSEVEPPETRTINPVAGMRVRYFGDYELLEEIARGGMGVVWKARQTSLNRIVALKMILSGDRASEREMERFRREAESAANLQHPNIVAIHEIGQRDGQHYFTMDYVEGLNLSAVVSGKPLSAQRAAGYMKTIAEAIHFAHQRGTLHRDLKPQNVLIDAQDQPRITDFGLAKIIGEDSRLTESGAIMGSPSYMPQEQACGRQDLVGPHSDVYSMGAILYELLTGRPPFQASTTMATLRQVVEDNPQPPRKLNPSVRPDLETICLKCLEKSPQMRYASARELAEDIGRFLKEEPIHARPVAVSRKVQQWFKQHPLFLAGAAALLLLALTASTYGLWQQNQYLLWHAANPQTSPVKGPRTAYARSLIPVASALLLTVVFAILLFNKLVRGVPLKNVLESAWITGRPIATPNPRILLAYELLSTGGIVFALYDLAKMIDAAVWENYYLRGEVGMVYALAFLNGLLLLNTRHDRHVLSVGRDPGSIDADQVPPEIGAKIGDLLREGMPFAAIKLYRKTTDCTPVEARTAVDNIAKQNGMRGIPPAKISKPKLLRNFAVSAAVLGGVLFFLSPAWRLPLLVQFLGGCGFTMIALVGRLSLSTWKRIQSMLAALILFWAILWLQCNWFSEFQSFESTLVGMFAGPAMIILAYKTPRKTLW